MLKTFILIWLVCNGPHGECAEQREYFENRKECLAAIKEIPVDKDGIPPLLATCMRVGGLNDCEKAQMKDFSIFCGE